MISAFTTLVLTCVLWCAAPATAAEAPSPFPPLEGWTLETPVQAYTPDTLFDYIDGAAEVYLSYNVERLEVGIYRRGKESVLTAEVFRHPTPEDAFGILARERPEGLAPSPLGAAAAVQADRASFISGRYYVKIAVAGAPEDRSGSHIRLAGILMKRLGGGAALPGPFSLFPPEGRMMESERYFAKEYLGYPCLPKAYSIRYGSGAQTHEAFLHRLKGAPEAEGVARCFASQSGMKILSKEPGTLVLADPHLGTLRLRWNDQWLWGVKGEGTGGKTLSDRMGASLASATRP